jgi:hypothetical protein
MFFCALRVVCGLAATYREAPGTTPNKNDDSCKAHFGGLFLWAKKPAWFHAGKAVTFREGANKQVISSQADSLIKISRIWADFFPQTHRISLFRLFFPPFLALFPVFTEISPTDVSFGPPETGWPG